MKGWMKLGIGAAAVVLAIAAGTAAFAMRGGGGNDTSEQKRAADDGGAFGICIEGATDCVDFPGDPNEDGQGIAEGEPQPSIGMCAPGVADCVDIVVNPAGGTCLEGTTDCVDNPADGEACPPGVACIEPGLMDPPVCPAGMTMEECFPDGPPKGYACVTLESDPIQVTCEPTDDSDGDPCSPEPDPNVRCLPPDCAVSSDGSVTCPEETVDPAEEGSGSRGAEEAPGSAGE